MTVRRPATIALFVLACSQGPDRSLEADADVAPLPDAGPSDAWPDAAGVDAGVDDTMPPANVWGRLADLPAGVYGQNGHRLGIALGEIHAYSGTEAGAFFRYERPPTDRWTLLPSPPRRLTYGLGAGPTTSVLGPHRWVYVIGREGIAGPGWLQRYDAQAGLWDSTLVDVDDDTGDFPKNGAAIAWDGGDNLFIAFGGAYSDERFRFYRYAISQWGSPDAWERRRDTPYRQQAGTALAWVPGELWGSDDDFVYAFVGGGNESTTPNKAFYSRRLLRYSVVDDAWTDLGEGAAVPSNVDDGGSLAWLGGGYLYAFPGASSSESNRTLLRFDLVAGVWETLAEVPVPVDDGGSLAFPGETCLYAIPGANTDEIKGRQYYRYGLPED